MSDWIKTTLGRKLIGFILTPILSAILISINAVLPEGARLTPEQMTNIIQYIIALAGTTIVGQSAADVVNGSPSRPKPGTDANPITANTVSNNGVPTLG